MEEKRIVGIYVRVSTQGQVDEGYSVDEQTEKLKKYCDVKDWEVYQVYTDGGFSGSNIERPAMELMIDDIKAKKINTVLVYKLDRLSRSQKDTLYLIEDVFNANDVSFISLNENFDTSTAFGKAMIGILSVFAQLEREQITMRMQMGRVGRAKAGLYNGGGQRPFGYEYKHDQLIVNPITAPIVQEIFKDYLDGMSLSALTQKYNKNGHIGRGKSGWSYHSMGYLLRNRSYLGEVSWKHKWYPGRHDPLISREDFDEVQRQLKIRREATAKYTNNPRPFRSKYMLSGLLRCGRCGGRMEIAVSKRKDGTRTLKYMCHFRKKSNVINERQDMEPCDLPYYSKEVLEKIVIDRILKVAFDPDKIKAILNQKKPIDHNINAIDARLKQITGEMSRLMDLYSKGNLPLDQINQKAESLNNEKNELEKHKQQISKESRPKPNVDFQKMMVKAQTKLRESSYDEQKIIVKQLIKKITVNGEQMTIEWRF